MSRIKGLCWEQLVALRILKETPDLSADALCKQADCSVAELYQLSERGLVFLGMERLAPKTAHPMITQEGLLALIEAQEKGLL